MADSLEQVGIVIKLDGAVETAAGIALNAKQIDELGEGLKKSAQAMGGFEQGAKKMETVQRSLTEQQERLIEKLKDQAATLGMNSSQLAIYRAQQAGLEGDNLKLVESLANKIQAHKDEQKAMADSEAAAGRLSATTIGVAAAIGTAVIQVAAKAFDIFKEKLTEAVNSGDRLDELAQRFKRPVAELNALKFVAEQAGSSFEPLVQGLSRAERVLVEAQRGSERASAAFRALEIDPTKIKGSSELMIVLAERLSRVEDQSIASAIAQRFFGTSGDEMLRVLQQGPEVLRQITEEGLRYNKATDANAAAAAKFKDEIAKLQFVMGELNRELLGGIIPTLTKYMSQITEATRLNNSFISGLTQVAANKVQGETLEKSTERVEKYRKALALLDAEAAGGKRRIDPAERPALEAALLRAQNQVQFQQFRLRQEIGESLETSGVAEPQARAAGGAALKVDVDKLNRERGGRSPSARTGKTDADIARENFLEGARREEQIQAEAQRAAEKYVRQEEREQEREAKEQARAEEELAREGLRLRQEERREALQRLNVMQREEEQRRKRAEALTLEVDGQARYNQKMDELFTLLASGTITMDVFTKQSKKAADELEAFGKKTDLNFKGIEDAIRGSAAKSTDAILDFVTKSGSSMNKLRDLAYAVARDIARAFIQKNLVEPGISAGTSFLRLGLGAIAGAFAPTAPAAGAGSGLTLGSGSSGSPAGFDADTLGSGLRLAPRSVSSGYSIEVNVDATGGSVSGAAGGQRLGENLVEAVRQVLREEIVTEQRPGGSLYAS
jgi:hypothetical protein